MQIFPNMVFDDLTQTYDDDDDMIQIYLDTNISNQGGWCSEFIIKLCGLISSSDVTNIKDVHYNIPCGFICDYNHYYIFFILILTGEDKMF